MKSIKLILAFLFLLALTSCVKFKDTDTWVFAEGLWIILAIPGLAALWGFYATYRGYNSGTYKHDMIKGSPTFGKWINGEGKMLPKWPLYVAIFCTILFVVILVVQNSQA